MKTKISFLRLGTGISVTSVVRVRLYDFVAVTALQSCLRTIFMTKKTLTCPVVLLPGQGEGMYQKKAMLCV